MLKNCPECGGTTSDQATSCPHCGHPLSPLPPAPPLPLAPEKLNQSRSPVFTVLAAFGFLLCLFTPRLILVLPLFGTIACAVIALFRRERARAASVIVLVLTVGLFLLSAIDSPSGSAQSSAALSSVKIEDWNWSVDPDFGTRGTVKWNASVRNLTEKYIENVRVELTTYDKDGKLITTKFTYVGAIPPAGTRSTESYADYYGTEGKASIQVTDVRLAR
ncbi:FxLYD domain-containing protein [Xanthomonas campestris]|uniref:FxLYD domain-containing protein n=2 Tax=Xanthomonas campestris TaxID=339 RepID=UPI000A943FB8|nr:FxLYD domain-containing protein [Xanthomonas campestris]WDI86813.1 hypothetical protein JH281_06595 [Xanthomonas campestris pv. campestris]